MRLIVAQDSDSSASKPPDSDEESTWLGVGVRERTAGTGPGGDIEDQRLFALVRARMFASAEQLRVGHYRIERQLGAGAMGEVHLALDEQLERPVAIKFVRAHLAGSDASKQRWAEQLRAEARALARLAHPNVVRVYEVGEYDERVYLAMEFIEGGSLRDWIRNASRTWEQVLAAYLDAGRGLAAAHAVGLVHSDFKPDNVLLGRDGRIAVADFGLASIDPEYALASDTTAVDGRLDSSRSGRSRSWRATGELRGTPGYMAPEQFAGWADARSDQFAFCVALFEGLWGRRPFPQFALDDAVHGEVEWQPIPPPSNTAVPGWVWPLLRRGLAREGDQRWPDLDALLSAIDARLQARRRRAWLLGSAFSAVLVGLLSAAAVGWWSHDPPPDACEVLDGELDATWDAPRRTALLDHYTELQTDAPYLGGSEAPVLAGLDRWRASWLEARTQLCRARAGGDVVVLDRQAACLERQRRSTQALVDELLTGDAANLRAAPLAIERLAVPSTCAVEARLGGPPPPPAAIAEAVAHMRDEHATVEAELLLARDERALARLDALDEQLRHLDHAPLRAEHELLRGRALLSIDPERGFAVLEHAADMAEGSHHDALVAESWRLMATAAATELPDLERGRRWLRRADAAATRVGVDELGVARLDYVRANLELLDNQYQAALELLEPVLPLFEGRGQRLFAADAATAIGTALLLGPGEPEAALLSFNRALDHAKAVYGPRHPELAMAAYNLGQVTLDAGLLDESRRLLERAVEIWSSSDASTAREHGRAELVLGQLALVEGRNRDVVAHGRAAASVFERAPATGELEQAEAAAEIGLGLYYLGEFAEATLALRRAVEGYAAVHGADDVYASRYRLGLGWSLLAECQHDEAAQAFDQALQGLLAGSADAADIFDARLGRIAVALATDQPEHAARELAAVDRSTLGELERMEFALLDAIAGRRTGGDAATVAAAFTEAAALAPTLANGSVILDILLVSVHASADERRLATPS